MKAPILRSGLVLVDLPGTHDSNAARSAVASRYIEQCSALWVVGPITRAVDDKAAQTLMSKTFKRQLQFDGMYANVTVICSKTDDISITEVLAAMPKDDDTRKLQSQLEQLYERRTALVEESKIIKRKLLGLRKTFDQLDDAIEELDQAIDRFGDEDGIVITSPLKRMAVTSSPISRKRQRADHDRDSDYQAPSDSEGTANSRSEPSEEYVSRVDAINRLVALKEQKRSLREEKRGFEKEHRRIGESLNDCQKEQNELATRIKSACIKYRNEQSRPTIQSQFAEGLRELDMDAAVEHDEQLFDPHHEQRDYSAVANGLAVFCVSSKAYQKKSGRLKSDETILGFPRMDDTEVPALQRHVRDEVDSARLAAYRRFCQDLYTLVSKLFLQVVAREPVNLANELCQSELDFLRETVNSLRTDCLELVDQTVMTCKAALRFRVIRQLDSAVGIASEAALPTVTTWASRRADGGLAWATYRATCRRKGAFESLARGSIDFNQDLIEPIMKHIGRQWERCFVELIPLNLDHLGNLLDAAVLQFSKCMTTRPELVKLKTFQLVTSQIAKYQAMFTDTGSQKSQLRSLQQEARKIFHEVLSERMESTYRLCTQESGIGCFGRMKDIMLSRVESDRDQMFNEVVARVKESLDDIIDQLKERLETQTARIVSQIHDDYKAVLTKQNVTKDMTKLQVDVCARLTELCTAFESSNEQSNDPGQPQASAPSSEAGPTASGVCIKAEEPLGS